MLMSLDKQAVFDFEARTAGNVATNVADIDAGTCGVCVLCDNIFSCSIKSDCAFWLQDKAMC